MTKEFLEAVDDADVDNPQADSDFLAMVLGAYSLVASHDDKVCWAASKISDAKLTQNLTILLLFFFGVCGCGAGRHSCGSLAGAGVPVARDDAGKVVELCARRRRRGEAAGDRSDAAQSTQPERVGVSL